MSLRPMTDRERRTIRLGGMIVAAYLVLFFGFQIWKFAERRRSDRPSGQEVPAGNARELPAKRPQGQAHRCRWATFLVQIEALEQVVRQLIGRHDAPERPHSSLFRLPDAVAPQQADQRLSIENLPAVTTEASVEACHVR